MSHMKKTIWVLIALLVMSACSEQGIPTLVNVNTKSLPDGEITIEGTDYRVKRAIALQGRKKDEEVWAIVVNGKTYSCTTATIIGCEFALSRAKKQERAERDMGY